MGLRRRIMRIMFTVSKPREGNMTANIANMTNGELLAICRASTPDDNTETKRRVVDAQTELFERQCGRGRGK